MTLGPYRTGDNPGTPITVDVLTDEDLDAYQDYSVTVRNPAGVIVANVGPFVFDGDEVTFTWPTGIFTTPGIYSLTITLMGAGLITLEPLSVVVEADTGWLTMPDARTLWKDAPSEDASLYRLLEVSRIMCETKAPAYTGRPPINYVQAQLLQARALWNTGHVSPDNSFGGEGGLDVYAYSMGYDVVKLLRPPRAVGAFF